MNNDVRNSLRTAVFINALHPHVLRNRVGGNDNADVYRIAFTGRSSLTLSLDRLQHNADMALLNAKGAVVQFSKAKGNHREAIARVVDPGTFYIRISGQQDSTRYRLKLVATPVAVLDPGNSPTPTPVPTPAPVPTPIPVPTPTPLPLLPAIKLTLAATGLNEPTFVTNARDGSNRIFVTEKQGKIQILMNGLPKATPFLDISDRVSTTVEQGLASVAFPANYASTGNFYVDYTNKSGDIVLSRFKSSAVEPNLAEPASEQILLTIPHPDADNHYAGQLQFDAKGYLYLSTGDGGEKNDPKGNAQNPQSLLGKILRIDVESTVPLGKTYAIPSSNPFTTQADPQDNVRDEIWSSGLRNPWRFSIDPKTGNLFIADVGQDRVEEINVQFAGSPGGQNYGWNRLEGSLPYPIGSPAFDATGFTPPNFSYTHTEGQSITGGYVYRGGAIASLQGTYYLGNRTEGIMEVEAKGGL